MDTRLLARSPGAAIVVRIIITALLLLPALSIRPAEGANMQRWAYYVKTDPYSLTSLEIAAKRLQVVLPYYFDLQASGEIEGSDDPAVTKLIRNAGAKVIPMIQNEARWEDLSPILQDASKRAAVQDKLVRLVKQYNYDGIQIDFEWMLESDRTAYSQFVTELKSKLQPAGKHLSVAVPDKPSEGFSSWSNPYDYAAIGKAADSVVVMAYGFRTINSEPGSYAPAKWVNSVMQYAVSQIPPYKIVMGIGLWGYDWDLSTEALPDSARRTRDILDAGRQKGAQFGFDEADLSAWSRYVDDAGVTHIVWFEDKRAVDAKTQIADRFGVMGTALWRLGQEDPTLWQSSGAVAPASTPAAKPASSVASPVPAPASNQPVPPAAAKPTPLPAVAPGLGRFFTETGGGSGKGFLVYDGGVDSWNQPVRFWAEFRRLGGVSVLGFPISHRYVGDDGFTYQVFQRAVLQWRPDQEQAVFANTFNVLQAAGKDDWLANAKGVPRTKEDDSGGNWDVAKAVRFSWLTDTPIRDAYLANPNSAAIKDWSEWDAIQLYGLPMSLPERSGPFISQRFQRVTLQLWVEDVAGMPPKGSVVPVLGGELLKEAGLIPAAALAPGDP